YAENKTLLLNEYHTFAQQFKLIEPKASEGDIIFAVKRHLQQYPHWLVVYDNAGDYQELEKFLPEKGGHLIITTRRQEWSDVAKPIPVDVFSEAEAITYLKQYLKRDEESQSRESEEKALKELIHESGCLPLALAQ